MRRAVIGVMGGHTEDDEANALATQLGQAIAEQGWILLNGGRNEGTMQAAAAACRQAGGFAVGILPQDQETGDEADLDLRIFTGMGHARNVINALSSDVVVALPGAAGTLSEVSHARAAGKPVVLLGFDDRDLFGDAVHRCTDVADAVAAIEAALPSSLKPQA